jgi:tryptophan-rich sensory protein
MNVALLYVILVAVNLPAPRLGLSFDEDISGTRLWYEPPGWVIPLVWWVLFTLLGLARYELGKARSGQTGRTLIVGLALLCASYAYYTLGLTKLTGVPSLWFGLFGNLIVIAYTLFVASRVRDVSPLAGCLVLTVALWTGYATAIVLGQLFAQGLL